MKCYCEKHGIFFLLVDVSAYFPTLCCNDLELPEDEAQIYCVWLQCTQSLSSSAKSSGFQKTIDLFLFLTSNHYMSQVCSGYLQTLPSSITLHLRLRNVHTNPRSRKWIMAFLILPQEKQWNNFPCITTNSLAQCKHF